jgi:hypothetical protein
MTIARLVTCIMAAACLASCGDRVAPSPAFPPTSRTSAIRVGASQIVGLPPGAMLPPVVGSDDRKSWIARDIASAAQLLFVSDLGRNAVEIFALPSLKEEGKLKGFDEPLGECSDAHGNVWIANNLKHEMLEYSRRGKLLNKIARPLLNPYSCAVNPVNGEIAVTDYYGPRYQPGEVLLYSSPSAKPVVIRNVLQDFYYYAAYDPSGHLWVDGIDTLGHFVLSKCGARSCHTTNLTGGSIFSGGAIAWDEVGRTLVVFDQYCRDTPSFCSYPVSARGVIGAPTIYLSQTGGALCELIQAAIATIAKRSVVVGADNEYMCGSYNTGTVNRWAYPAGGEPTGYKEGVVIYPWGAAVSTK